MKFCGTATGGGRDGHLQPDPAEGFQKLRCPGLQRDLCGKAAFAMLRVEPIVLREWKAWPEMHTQHLVRFRTGDADQRMAEGVGDSETDSLHSMLESREVNGFRIVKRAVHIENDGSDLAGKGHLHSLPRYLRTEMRPGAFRGLQTRKLPEVKASER